MKNIFKKSLIFKNLSEEEISSLLSLGNSFEKKFKKQEIIINEGDKTNYFHVLLDGEATIYQSDIDGNVFLKSKLLEGSFFAYIFAITKKESNCTVTAVVDSRVLYFDVDKILKNENNTVRKFKDNLIFALANTTYNTTEHLSTLALKTLRKKLFSYLKNYNYQNKTFFEVKLNRQQMSEYLGVNRTSLSKELIELKNQKIIDYKKNKFIILNIDYFESLI
ncbi:MAG: Crp/Fnr family transcriptional regulator [Bacilli bacterium]